MSGLHDGSQGVGNKCGYRSPCHGQEANEQEVGKGMIYNFDVYQMANTASTDVMATSKTTEGKGLEEWLRSTLNLLGVHQHLMISPTCLWRNGSQYYTMPATSMSGLWGMPTQV